MGPDDSGLVRRLVRTWAADAAAFARVLARIDPAWGSQTFPIAGGQLVLCGRGMYVNRAMAMGLDAPLTDGDLDLIEQLSEAAGVPAAVEVSPATHADVEPRLLDRGYEADDVVTALVVAIGDGDPVSAEAASAATIVIEPAADSLELWQQTSALGWGHSAAAARRASDAFSAAAAEVDGEGFVIALSADDRRPLGCASMTTRNGVATLGGMSTVPTERGRGVQTAMVDHRVRLAWAQGCDVAASTAVTGGASERNLIRLGFRPLCRITTYVRL